MRESKLSTTDFVAVQNESPAHEIPVQNDNGGGNDVVGSGAGGGAQMTREPGRTPLFADAECQDFRSRWDQIQARFVDDPRRSVEDADNLVATTMSRLAEIFSAEREKMEGQWSRGDNVSTEDLRLALQRYRSFFNRLLVI